MDQEGGRSLFSEFPGVDTAAWMERIVADLKGASFDDKLIRMTEEEIPVYPFYRELDPDTAGRHATIRSMKKSGDSPNAWTICQDIEVNRNRKEAGQQTDEALRAGAQAIRLLFTPADRLNMQSLNALVSGTDPTGTGWLFKGYDDPGSLYELLSNLVEGKGLDQARLKGGLGADPVKMIPGKGTSPQAGDHLAELVTKVTSRSPLFKSVEVDGALFQEAGANLVQELAFTAGILSETLYYLTGIGLDAVTALRSIEVSLCAGPDYFVELSKFRAARILFGTIARAYGIRSGEDMVTIHATTSKWNLTLFDPHSNLLRATSQAMSAILGGADVVSVTPFDHPAGTSERQSARLARNLQLILKKEAYFDQVSDPAAGAYFIENLTGHLIEKSWELFCQAEDRGGYFQCVEEGWIQEQVHASRQKKLEAASTGEKTILGTNAFPDARETSSQKKNRFSEEGTSLLQPFRVASGFEEIRLETERARNRPRVFLFKFGNPVWANARAGFAANYFGCAGYEIIEAPVYENASDGILRIGEYSPEVVVLCSSDEAYLEHAKEVHRVLGDDSLLVVAGNPRDHRKILEEEGVSYFIHTNSPHLEILKEFNSRLLRHE